MGKKPKRAEKRLTHIMATLPTVEYCNIFT